MKNYAKMKKVLSRCPFYYERKNGIKICNPRHDRVRGVTEETEQRFCLTTNNYHSCLVYRKYQTD